MPVQARGVFTKQPGGPEVLAIEPFELRDPGPAELLVAVKASALNRADVLERMGRYPAPIGLPSPAGLGGLEYAGEIVAIGEGALDARVGDRVMGILGGGAMATHAIVPAREAIPIPSRLSFEEAAAVPEAFLTAFDALALQAGMGMGQSVLIHAAGSGVGTAAVQLARAAGAVPIGTSRTEDKLDRARGVGLERGVVVEEGRFAEEVLGIAGRAGVDVVLDLVGGAYLKENLRVVRSRGRIVVVGLVGGASSEMPLGLLLQKRVTMIGTVLRTRPAEEKAALAQTFIRRVLPLLASGSVSPVIDEVLPMDDVAEAHRRMEANETFGKLVLVWS